MAIDYLGSSRAAPLFFHKDLRLKQRTNIVHAFVWDPHLDSFGAFISGCRIKIQAVTARMQVCAAIFALVRRTDAFHHLNFLGTVVTARNQMELRFDSSARPFRTRRRFRSCFPVIILITGLTIFSSHFLPQNTAGFNKAMGKYYTGSRSWLIQLPISRDPIYSSIRPGKDLLLRDFRILTWNHPGGLKLGGGFRYPASTSCTRMAVVLPQGR